MFLYSEVGSMQPAGCQLHGHCRLPLLRHGCAPSRTSCRQQRRTDGTPIRSVAYGAVVAASASTRCCGGVPPLVSFRGPGRSAGPPSANCPPLPARPWGRRALPRLRMSAAQSVVCCPPPPPPVPNTTIPSRGNPTLSRIPRACFDSAISDLAVEPQRRCGGALG